ncbi:hypothetical protein BKA62DRAFT_723590 [Auriculariales sp. MPI-PUGE-AT-0066]|nr:hypothetical protein BKA62DRAFT_723590 [Auriculariales sp. MPI-PUGE-AT-0066]
MARSPLVLFAPIFALSAHWYLRGDSMVSIAAFTIAALGMPSVMSCWPHLLRVVRLTRAISLLGLSKFEGTMSNVHMQIFRRAPTTNLPHEILYEVFGYLVQQSMFGDLARAVARRELILERPEWDMFCALRPRYSRNLRSCALVCRAWSQPAREVQYEHLALANIDSQALDSLYVYKCDDMLRRVKRLSLPHTSGDRWLNRSRGQFRTLRGWLHTITEFVSAVVPLLRSLEEIDIWVTTDTAEFELQLRQLDATPPAKLRSLTLHALTRSSVSNGALFGPRLVNNPSLDYLMESYTSSHGWVGQLERLSLRHFVSISHRVKCQFGKLRELEFIECSMETQWLSEMCAAAPKLQAVSFIDAQFNGSPRNWTFAQLGRNVVDQLVSVTLVSPYFSVGPGQLPGDMSMFSNVRLLTLDLRSLKCMPRAPPQLQDLSIVLRPRSPRSARSLLNDIMFIRIAVSLLRVRGGASSLDRLHIWDYVSYDLEDVYLAIGCLLTQCSRLVLRGVEVQFNLVRLPFSESDLSQLNVARLMRTGQPALRRTLKSTTQLVPKWLNRQGVWTY